MVRMGMSRQNVQTFLCRNHFPRHDSFPAPSVRILIKIDNHRTLPSPKHKTAMSDINQFHHFSPVYRLAIPKVNRRWATFL